MCDAYHTPPDYYGITKPQTIRNMRTAFNVMQLASYRKESGNAAKWDKSNPAHAKYLKMIRKQSRVALEDNEVEVELPKRKRK